MNLRRLWVHFWKPPGRGIGIFFCKFILFTILTFSLWNIIKTPYNYFLKDVSLHLIRKKLPYIGSRFYEDMKGIKDDDPRKSRGLLEIQFAPFVHGPIPLKKPKPVSVKLYLNTLHYNIIPFISFLLASPFITWKRLVFFLLIGSAILGVSHIWHIQLDLLSYYFQMQTFEYKPASLHPQQLQNAQIWLYKLKVLQGVQGFMEQAGSMIIPAFIWMIYAAKWILHSLLGSIAQKTSRVPGTPKNSG